jgi:hypothetical protein
MGVLTNPFAFLNNFGEGSIPQLSLGDNVFNFSGENVIREIPSGASTMEIKLWGGGGSGGIFGASQTGGGGGFTIAEYSVSPGDRLIIQVGEGGYPGLDSTEGGQGGWPDGGDGGRGDAIGGGGGGSSRIWLEGVLVAVAGGGGGAAGFAVDAGAGGGSSGENGSNSTTGSGGSQIAGGVDQNDNTDVQKTGVQIDTGTPGSINRTGGQGFGDGVADRFESTSDDGGGGGGGFYGGGGGGGDADAGGGGSGYLDGSESSGSTSAGIAETPAGTGDGDYPGSPIGEGSNSTFGDPGNSGGDGYIIINLS